eukprot:1290297-Rhodomonas_salina.4
MGALWGTGGCVPPGDGDHDSVNSTSSCSYWLPLQRPIRHGAIHLLVGTSTPEKALRVEELRSKRPLTHHN